MIIIKLAVRNLFRNTRRTVLTAILIIIGIVLVVMASSVTSGFRNSVIDLLTNTQLSHFQVHESGYMDSIDTIPLNIFMNETEMYELTGVLSGNPGVEAFSPRIKLSSMISNGTSTSSLRLTAVYPEKESKVCPGIIDQMDGIEDKSTFLKPGEIVIPDVMAKGLSLKTGDEVSLKTTNRDGKMNSADFRIAGVMTTVESPSGRSGYIHMDNAKELLQMDTLEISEVAVRVKNAYQGSTLNDVIASVGSELSGSFEIHSWEKLSPFASILVLVNLINIMVQFILIAIVLISVLNIMMMSVYERTHEIGTISAIGTTPRKILSLFLAEGITLGLLTTAAGSVLGLLLVWLLSSLNIHFKAGPFNMVLNGDTDPASLLITAVLVLAVSLAASCQPAMKAARLEPVDALGHI